MNYLPVNVYTHADPFFGDCTNGGVTADPKAKLVVPCADGHFTAEDVRDRGYTILVPGEKGGRINFVPEGVEGWTMFGGNFVYTSDSRFSRAYSDAPVHVHDRVEA